MFASTPAKAPQQRMLITISTENINGLFLSASVALRMALYKSSSSYHHYYCIQFSSAVQSPSLCARCYNPSRLEISPGVRSRIKIKQSVTISFELASHKES